MQKATVICVLPVRNESWVLRHFIECAQAWADLIILGDHNSTDSSIQMAKQYAKVRVIPLSNPAFDAALRRKMLFDEARAVPGKRLIFAIDADEMISANWTDSLEWNRMLEAEPGTSFNFDWVELLPGLKQCAIFGQQAAFIDDDKEYSSPSIHEQRIPPAGGEVVQLHDIKLLHYIDIDPKRMLSKHRWYKCVEYLEIGKRPWPICIMYQDTKIKSYDAPICSVEEAWIKGYTWLDDYKLTAKIPDQCYWYDEEVLNFFDTYGTRKFSKLNIWDVDWNQKAQLLSRKGNYSDPRSKPEVWIHKFIERHREELKLRQSFKWKAIRLFGKTVLRALGW